MWSHSICTTFWNSAQRQNATFSDLNWNIKQRWAHFRITIQFGSCKHSLTSGNNEVKNRSPKIPKFKKINKKDFKRATWKHVQRSGGTFAQTPLYKWIIIVLVFILRISVILIIVTHLITSFVETRLNVFNSVRHIWVVFNVGLNKWLLNKTDVQTNPKNAQVKFGITHAFQQNFGKLGQDWRHNPFTNVGVFCKSKPKFTGLLCNV